MNKDISARLGLALMNGFLKANDLDPIIVKYEKIGEKSVCGYGTLGGKPEEIIIDVNKCSSANIRYSFPGLYCDRTPFGVHQHEMGHVIDGRLRLSREAHMYSHERPLTSYCPNNHEWFAEMFRLFVTNSDLLRRLRPKVYDFLIDEARLVPTVTDNYIKVLKECYCAPDFVIQRAMNKVAREGMS
jgi:hypothetical protein